jgi:FKBP-type peptidyl-prolyl cis-trans isomerase (trigger factor)
MKVTVEELSPSKRALHVELPSERVTDRVEAAFREWGQKLQLPGFRRGSFGNGSRPKSMKKSSGN